MQIMAHSRTNRFLSVEFCAYYLVIGVCLWRMIERSFDLSREFDRGGSHWRQLPGLASGWLFGRSVDLSDIQWRELRGNLFALCIVFSAFVVVSKTVWALSPQWHQSYYLVFSLAYIGYLHGAFAVHLLVLILANYVIAKRLAGKKIGPLIFWIFNCGALILARISEGLPFHKISVHLGWLDAFKGPMRWHICFNLVMLRLVSFGMDLHWMRINRTTEKSTKSKLGENELGPHASVKARSEASLKATEYGLAAYLVYVLYPPLYLTGPTSTYNNFAWQLHRGQSVPFKRAVLYGFRSLCSFLILEVMTHTMYTNGLAKYRAWRKFSELQSAMNLSVIGFWVLIFMWLKFLVIWRFFRFWSLCDGMEVPENMTRCLCNNYDIEGFWKNWHASYNLWLVRYIYIPLGGSNTRILNVWCIFTFVALWHDLEWKLLGWAWLMAGFIAPEMVIKWAARQPAIRQVSKTWWYRHACALLVSFNILCLMTANMIGFVTGLDGILDFLGNILSNLGFLLPMLAAFFATTHIMFEIREHESHNGKRLCPMA